MSSGNSAKAPTSETSTARPSPNARKQAAGGFAHRGIAQVQHDVAGRDVAGEILDGREAEHAYVRREIQRTDQGIDREVGMLLARKNHLGARLDPRQPAERAQGFGNALVRLEVPEDADQRSALVQAQAVAEGKAVHLRNPGAMRDERDGSREARRPHLAPHEFAVYNQGFRRFEQTPGHGEAFVVGPYIARLHAPRVRQSGRAAVVFGLATIALPVVAPDGQVRDQVVQVGFMHDHHAGMNQRRFINKIVMGIVANLVEREVEIPRAKLAPGLSARFDLDQTSERRKQCLRVIRYSAAGWRQG